MTPECQAWVQVISTVVLTLSGIAGIIIAVKTLRTLIQQTQATRLNAEAIVNAERAWIDGELKRSNPDDRAGLIDLAECPYDLQVANRGRTPAYIVGWQIFSFTLAEGVRELPASSTSTLKKELQLFLPPNESAVLHTFDMAQDIADWMDVLTGKKTGAFKVTVKYFDIVTGIGKTEECHETSFAYSYSIVEGGFERRPSDTVYK